MKKKILINIGAAVVLIAVAVLAGAFIQRERDERQRAALLTAQREQNEQHEAALDRARVELLPGTTREMLSADYWKNGLSGELLFTAEEIRDFQRNDPPFVAYFDAAAGGERKLRMYDLPDEITGYAVRALIGQDFIDDRADGTVKVYVNGQTPDAGYWDALRNNCAFDLIPETVTPRYCVCVKRGQGMLVPTEDFASGTADGRYCNEFVSAEVMPLTGVAVLHESRDRQWCFVINGYACGWVKTDCLAFCTDREQWLEAIRPEDFLTVTACELMLDETAVPTKTAGLMLPMGTRIPLLSGCEGAVNGREAYSCYVASVPCRGEDGTLKRETVLIPVSKDVVVGALTMTSDALLEQAFKFLGKIYGWGGAFSSNDCSGIVRQIYACFGFELPRNSAAIGENFDLGGREIFAMTAEKKLELLKRLPAGSLLLMEGHLMIYLGTVDNRPYVLSSCGTFFMPDDKTGSTPVEANGVFVSSLELRRADGKTWLESLRYCQFKEY